MRAARDRGCVGAERLPRRRLRLRVRLTGRVGARARQADVLARATQRRTLRAGCAARSDCAHSDSSSWCCCCCWCGRCLCCCRCCPRVLSESGATCARVAAARQRDACGPRSPATCGSAGGCGRSGTHSCTLDRRHPVCVARPARRASEDGPTPASRPLVHSGLGCCVRALRTTRVASRVSRRRTWRRARRARCPHWRWIRGARCPHWSRRHFHRPPPFAQARLEPR